MYRAEPGPFKKIRLESAACRIVNHATIFTCKEMVSAVADETAPFFVADDLALSHLSVLQAERRDQIEETSNEGEASLRAPPRRMCRFPPSTR